MKNVKKLAKEEILTKQTLLSQIQSRNFKVTIYQKNKIDEDVDCIVSKYDLSEQCVIYCFLRLFEEEEVMNFEFEKAYESNMNGKTFFYLKEYYENFVKNQE